MSAEHDSAAARAFEVGPWRVEPGLDRLLRDGESVAVEPKAMDLLVCLARHAGETVSKETLLEEVWHGSIVVESVIAKSVSALRHSLGDDAAEPRFILTVPRRGYRLVAPVRWLGSPPPTAAEPATGPAPSAPSARGVEARALGPGARIAVFAAAAALLVGWALLARRAPAPAPSSPPSSAAPVPEAVERLLLEARHLWSRRGLGDLGRAHELWLQAVREAPASAEAHGWLSISHVTSANYVGAQEEALASAEREASRALELDPRSAIAHAAAGLVALNARLDVAAAIAEQQRALDLEPTLVPAHQYLAEALSAADRHDEALAAIDEALRREPLSPVLHGVRGLVLVVAGRPLGALEAFDRTLVLDPRFGWVHRYRAYAFAALGRESEAAEALVEEARLSSTSEELAALTGEIERDGLAGYWRWRLDGLEAIVARGERPRPTQYAEALAANGRLDAALEELAKAPAARDGEYFLYYRASPAFDAVRARPEFRALYAGLAAPAAESVTPERPAR